MPFSQERTDLIKARLEERLASSNLNAWQKSFFMNMLNRFKRDGTSTNLTKAQYKKLDQLIGFSQEGKSSEALKKSRQADAYNQSVSQVPASIPKRTHSNRQPRRQNVSPLRAIYTPQRAVRRAIYAPQRAVRRVTRQLVWPVMLILGLMGLIVGAFETGGSSSSHKAKGADQGTAIYLVVTGSSVNQRTGPSTADPVIGQLSAGTRVLKRAERNGWTQITSELGTGWMSSRFLRSQGSRVVAKKQSEGRTLRASDVRVIDGDTIYIRGQTANVRLVGFNTPETRSPQCNAEYQVGFRATARLRGLIQNAQSLEYERVACACRPGTEGTRKCNYGRQCGVLKVNGTDVGRILISEGLAVRYICGRTSCPPRPGNWCR